MKIIEKNGAVCLEFSGRSVFEHSAKRPFITAVDADTEYKSSHGNFKVKEKIIKSTPLKLTGSERTEYGYRLNFSEGDRSVAVRVCENGGALSLAFEPNGRFGVEFAFRAVADEAIFGGGEQFRQLDMKGERIVNFVSEHIVIPPIAQKILLKRLYREKKHSYIETYCPMTTYVSSRKYAVRFDADSYGVADFTEADRSSFRFCECPKSALFAVGGDFKDIGRILNADCGNREYLPDWCYDGMILGVQGGIDRAERTACEMLDAGARVSAVWCQDWSGKKVTAAGKQVYWNWEADKTLYPSLEERIAALKAKGVRFLAYINPYLVRDGKLYDYCRQKGYLIRHKDGSVYHVKSTTFDAGMLDLTNPKAVEYVKETLIKRNMLDLGVDGYMADFGEYLPVDCLLYKGDPKLLHNQWPLIWAKINRDAVESHPRADEVFFFTRSGYNGAQKHTPIMWNGDQHTDFSKDYGFGCVMPATFNLGFSGMCAAHSDIGGFISFAGLKRDKELFVRWMETSAFSPLMRSHETIRPEVNAQPYDEEILPYAAKLSSLHAAIKPYIKECMKEANEGVPVMRPDFYDGGDYSKHKDLYSYRFGNETYVCPVVKRGETTRKVSLPDGKWIKFFDNTEFEGGKEFCVDAKLGTPVAFYKKGGKFEKLFRGLTI